MFQTISRYEEDGFGLPYSIVLIHAAEEEIDPKTGDRIGVSVPDMEGLAIATAVARVLIPLQLAGEEVRFLRSVLNMTAREMAAAIDIDPASLSRWENGKQELGGWADKQVRLITIVQLADAVPHMALDHKSVIPLRIRKRRADEWPTIEMCRPHAASTDLVQDDFWDMRLAA